MMHHRSAARGACTPERTFGAEARRMASGRGRGAAAAPLLVGLASALLLLLLLLAQHAEARPSGNLSRPKRVSDQRLAELETLIALAKMRGKLVTVPIGFGKVDPMKIGRRRRSSTESNLQELRRILRAVVEEDAELSPKDRSRYARLFASRWGDEEATETGGDPAEDEALY